ncbi:MAG: hypothetical protein ACRDJS_02925 [Actinomycetota bacterium]
MRRDAKGLPTGAPDAIDQQRSNHLTEREAIDGAFAAKTELLENLGLRRRPRMTYEEIVRLSGFEIMVASHYGADRYRCSCFECRRYWARRDAA